MKSIEQVYSEFTEAALLSGKVSRDQITEVTKDVPTVEQRLSAVKKLAESKGFKESAPRIMRKNGSAIRESVDNTQENGIRHYMKRTGASFREASIVLFGTDPGRDAKFSKEFVESLKTKWRNSGAIISEQEINTLAERGIEP